MEIKKEGSSPSFKNIVVNNESEVVRTNNTDAFAKSNGLDIIVKNEDDSVSFSADNQACSVDEFVDSSVNHKYYHQQVFTIKKLENRSPDSTIDDQVFAIEKTEECSADIVNEDVFTIVVENSRKENDFKQHEETIVSGQKQETTRRVFTGEKVDKSTSTEDHYTVISKSQLYLGDNASITKPLSDATLENSVDRLTNNVIEIDDSSEEEVLDSLISEERRGTSTSSQSTFYLCSKPQTEQEPSLQSGISSCSDNVSVLSAFETAVDDWYSKLSVHGPLMDSEILESAQQLARHFNFEFSGDAEWLRTFKHRHECENGVNNRPDQHAVTNCTGMTSLSDNKLIASSKSLKRDMANQCDDEGVTKRPRTVTSPMLTPKIEVEEPHADFEEGVKNSNFHEDRLLQFENELLEWYCLLTAKPKVMIAASVFEHKAIEIAQSLNLFNFRPTKTWLKMFVSRHGMWCIHGKNRFLFLEPKAGVLKSRYDVEFEAWYYVFPLSPDLFLDYERDFDDVRINANSFLTGVFDWYVAQASTVSAEEILTAEADIAKAVGLPNTKKLEVYYRNWVHVHDVFYKGIEEAYSISSPVLFPRVLKNVAIRRAKTWRIKGFCCHPTWMRRYLQINGLIYQEGEVVNCYRFDPNTCESAIFDRIFQQWLGCTANGNRWLREALSYLVPETVVPEKDPLRMVEDETEQLDQPLKIVSSFTLSDEPV